MSLRQEQSAFALDILKLGQFIAKRFDFVFGEFERKPEMQKIYIRRGLSKTMESYHLKKLAADIFFFDKRTGGLILAQERLQEIGDYWESLSPKNSWGGNWKSFKDLPHFERRA